MLVPEFTIAANCKETSIRDEIPITVPASDSSCREMSVATMNGRLAYTGSAPFSNSWFMTETSLIDSVRTGYNAPVAILMP